MKKLIFTTALLIASSLTVNAQLKFTMKLSAYDLASFNESTQCWETASGKYTFRFGANVEDIRANATVNNTRTSKVQCHDVMKPSMELK